MSFIPVTDRPTASPTTSPYYTDYTSESGYVRMKYTMLLPVKIPLGCEIKSLVETLFPSGTVDYQSYTASATSSFLYVTDIIGYGYAQDYLSLCGSHLRGLISTNLTGSSFCGRPVADYLSYGGVNYGTSCVSDVVIGPSLSDPFVEYYTLPDVEFVTTNHTMYSFELAFKECIGVYAYEEANPTKSLDSRLSDLNIYLQRPDGTALGHRYDYNGFYTSVKAGTYTQSNNYTCGPKFMQGIFVGEGIYHEVSSLCSADSINRYFYYGFAITGCELRLTNSSVSGIGLYSSDYSTLGPAPTPTISPTPGNTQTWSPSSRGGSHSPTLVPVTSSSPTPSSAGYGPSVSLTPTRSPLSLRPTSAGATPRPTTGSTRSDHNISDDTFARPTFRPTRSGTAQLPDKTYDGNSTSSGSRTIIPNVSDRLFIILISVFSVITAPILAYLCLKFRRREEWTTMLTRI